MSQFIRVIDDVLSPALCEQIIDIFESSPNLKAGTTSGGVDPEKKRSTDVSIMRFDEFAPIRQAVLEATSEQLIDYFREHFMAIIGTMGLTVRHPTSGEPVKLSIDNFAEIGEPNIAAYVQYLFRIGEINAQKYQCGSGGYPYWHSETYPQAGHNDALHRVLLFMFYLNDVDEGGTTDFYYQNQSVKPKKGRMVIAPAYFTHTHRGAVPVSNDKYILTSWLMFNPAERIYGQS